MTNHLCVIFRSSNTNSSLSLKGFGTIPTTTTPAATTTGGFCGFGSTGFENCRGNTKKPVGDKNPFCNSPCGEFGGVFGTTRKELKYQELALNSVFNVGVGVGEGVGIKAFMEQVGIVYDASKANLLEEITIGILVFTFLDANEDATAFKSAVKEFGLGALDAQKIFFAFRNACI